MICPHCGKPISRKNKITESLEKKILKLHKEGYSVRDIEYKLKRAVSHSTIHRVVKGIQR